MNQTSVKVSFYLKKSEADADRNCSVMIKSNAGRYSEAAFSVKTKVPQSRWSSGRASGKNVVAKGINNRLDEIRAMTLSIYIEQSAVHDGVVTEEVKGILLGVASGQETLLGYSGWFIRNFEERVGISRMVGNLRAYSDAYSHVERFLQAQYKLSDIPFSALNHSFIDRYDLYLRTERNLAPGTIINPTIQLKTTVREAIAGGIITVSPSMGYEPVRPKHVQRYLMAGELHRIMTTLLCRQILYHIRDMFLFSRFTGIPYGDIRLLTEDNLCLARDGIWWIESAGQEVRVEFKIPPLDLPLQILKEYSGTAPGDKLLPMYYNSMLNLYLKEIARICHIDRPLVFHTGRHTYATEIILSHGVLLEVVSRMLGHSQIETTQIYAEVTDEKTGTDTRASNRKISERSSVVI